MANSKTLFTRYAWALLAYNILVILWGAVVSSTGSGAGCGEHWPDCNGQIVPRNANLQTLIEFSHRLTSGLDGLLVIALVVGAWRVFPPKHRVRRAALASFIFVLLEGLIGALLVRQGWTALDTSVERVIMQPLHLVNTLFLLAALNFTAWWASGGAALAWRGQGVRLGLFGVGLLGALLTSGLGALISLGDLLALSISENYNGLITWLVGLRLWHPGIAVAVGVYLLWLAFAVARATPNATARRLAYLTAGLVLAQWAAGFLNVWLRVPLWTQIAHLLLADLIWLALLLWATSALAQPESQPAATSPQPRGVAAN